MIPAVEWARRSGKFRRLPRIVCHEWLHQVRHLILFTVSPILSPFFIFRSLSALSASHGLFVTSSQLVLLKCLSTGDFKMPLTQHKIHLKALAQPQG